jgi:hypothetical protein
MTSWFLAASIRIARINEVTALLWRSRPRRKPWFWGSASTAENPVARTRKQLLTILVSFIVMVFAWWSNDVDRRNDSGFGSRVSKNQARSYEENRFILEVRRKSCVPQYLPPWQILESQSRVEMEAVLYSWTSFAVAEVKCGRNSPWRSVSLSWTESRSALVETLVWTVNCSNGSNTFCTRTFRKHSRCQKVTNRNKSRLLKFWVLTYSRCQVKNPSSRIQTVFLVLSHYTAIPDNWQR